MAFTGFEVPGRRRLMLRTIGLFCVLLLSSSAALSQQPEPTPPENDPNVTFTVPVQSGVAYRCWIHMKVGEPKGVSTANKLYVQFTGAVDKANKEILRPRTASYLTAQGPTQVGWTWVACDPESGGDRLVRFQTSGEVTVRLQGGAEGVGFDQFILSPARFVEKAPTEGVVSK